MHNKVDKFIKQKLVYYSGNQSNSVYTVLCAANFNDMKLKYEAQKRTRINYRFMGFTTFEQGWWHNDDLNKWEFNPQHGKYNYGSHEPCRSVRAFRRKLKKAPKGVEFILVSRWVGHNVTGFGCA